MKIDEKTFRAMPTDLQALFVKLPNPGSEEVVGLFPETGLSKGGGGPKSPCWTESTEINKRKDYGEYTGYLDSGSAARFFYCAKASRSERGKNNNHPTCKPTALMRYLCRLITPPGGTILDCFAGSGTTGKAAILEGFDCILIEKEEEYVPIIKARIEHAKEKYKRDNAQLEMFS